MIAASEVVHRELWFFCSKEDRDTKEAVQAATNCREAAQVDVLISQSQSAAEATRSIGISEVTCYR